MTDYHHSNKSSNILHKIYGNNMKFYIKLTRDFRKQTEREILIIGQLSQGRGERRSQTLAPHNFNPKT